MVNETIFENFKFKIEDEDLNPEKGSFWILLVALLTFVLWVIFLTFYLSRVTGLLVSFALNRLLRFSKSPGHVKVGSFSISLLSGKIMLKDLVYANEDFSLRCNDGWIIFSYWRFVPGKEIDHNDLTSRLHLSLNGVQVHWYNRVGRYKEIAKLFNMEKYFADDEMKRAPSQEASPPVTKWDRFWALVGAIRLDIWSGRCVVGNQLLPYMFDLSWENMTSKIKLCESAADRALLSIEGQMESVKASFVKHPDYDGPSYKDPPRTMGDGFDVLQSASLSFFYHQDILGFVTLDKQTTEKRDRPIWESIWRFGPNTVVSYGPWAEQQRALIYKFFFPPDYQTAPVTELPSKGQRRIHIMHDVRISFLKESSIDVWFMRGEQLESIYNRCQAGSSVDMSIWWITNEEGFSWSANFSLLKVVSTTSLLFRRLFECETMRIDCSFHYPRVFNAKQTWRFTYNVSKATMWFVWDHKRFFTDLINEWVGDAPSDLLQFIPYEVYTDLFVTDGIEVIMLLNNGNWVDPSEMQSENDECAIVGEKFTLSFVLPFNDFLPETIKMSFSMLGENEMAMRFKYPSNSATAPLLAMLSRAAHVTSNAPKSTFGNYSKNDLWHECWRTEKVTVSFDYKYYPIVTEAKSSLPLHVLQEFVPPKPTHPKELLPDHLGVFIELDGSEVQFTGLLIRFILELKNNYFGYYDSMTDITEAEEQTSESTQHHSMFNKVSSTNPQVELYRPMEVEVELKVHNIRAHVLMHSMGGAEPDPCPVFYTEELVMEMKKTYSEMVVQVAVGQCAAHFERASTFQPDGFLSLSGFQFRGQALLSPVEVPWDMAVVEYSWQIEILIGELKGSLELSNHVFALAHVIETILLFILSQDDEKKIPTRFSVCPHGQLTSYCTRSKKANRHCEGEDSVKYRQIRVSVDGAKLALCDDKSSVIDVSLDPIRFTICNGHEGRFTEHICVRAPSISIKQVMRIPDSHQWLEVAKIAVDGVALDIQLPLPDDGVHLEKARHDFIKKHDYSSRRLHFLYAENKVWECACFGKTRFFGNHDLIGNVFMSHPGQKLFVPTINEIGQQPGVLQSLLRPNAKALREERHRVYPSHRRNSADSNAMVSNSVDTGSFHSALSHQKDTRPSASRALMIAYSKYLSHIDIQKPASEPPKIGMPGELTAWASKRDVQVNITRTGINAVQIQREKLMVEATANGTARKSNEVPSNHLAIQGSVAHSMEVFISPLSIEMLEKLVTTIAGCIHKVSPAALIQHTYLDCVIKSHRQPLTESLFTNSKRQLIVDVSLDLPRVHCSMFQCGLAEHHHALNENDKAQAVSANILLAMIDGATITSASDRNLHGTSFSLNCAVVNSQLLQVVSKAEADFSAARTPFRSSVNWLKSDIGMRLIDRELRVMMDLHIPDVVVTLEEKNKPMLFENGNSNSNAQNSSLLTLENTTKISIGEVKALVVMARPLEKTAKHEFPLYDALSPAITAWLNVGQRLDFALDRLSQTVGEWSDLSFARMMKLALECTDESILGAKGKHMMDCVKLLGKHQNSCPTCLLLKILMRWYALPESVAHLHTPITVRCGFENGKTRKTAMMALLSHWHPDICQMVKLASNFEAAKYRADPAQKKEVRINIDGNVTESRHRRNGSAASRHLAREAQAEQNETHSSKLDLYSYIRSAHRERNERKEGKKGKEAQPKDYVNPMDILPQAFFYSFYRMCRLDWTQLDGFFVDHLKLKYDIIVNQIAVDLVEPKLLSSPAAEGAQKLLAPCLHHLVTVKKIGLGGDLSWSIDMDEKNLMPIRGRAHLTYNGTVEDVQFVFAIASVCLAKEVILVVKAASDTLAELKKQVPSNPMTPGSDHSISARSGNFDQQAWDEKVFDMMKDFEKNVQRSGAVQRGDVLTAVHGQLQIADIRLETRLTDLYVAFDMKSIELLHEHNPIPIKKSTVPHEIDVLRFKLRKAKLNIRQSLSEGAKTNESKPILHCGLQESNATLVRKHLVVDGVPPKVDTSLAISLGPIEGELPMSAGSLHDVVMKHGPQLEIELDRLSAQPQTLQEPGLLAVDAMSPIDHSWHKGPLIPPMKQKATQIVRVVFSFKLESVELKARILPSLLAMYRMKHASSTGETGGNAQWVFVIEHHFAEFHVSPVDKPGDSFTLDLPAIDVNGQYLGDDAERNDGGEAPATDRSLHYRKGGYLKMLVTLGRVNHSFTTELLNHILFAEQSFRTELSSLVSRISAQRTDTRPVVVAPPPSADKPPLLFFLTIKGTSAPKEPWLQLTAATPTATAVRFTIDTLETELTNRWVVREEGSSRERIFGCAVLQCSAKLGQLVKAAQYEEIAAELQEYATFMTQIRVENKESSKKSYSYHIALSRPILMIKSTAIDKAILLWLNYKNTYDYWRAERSRFEKSVSEEKRHSISQSMFSPQPSQDFDINLSLSINNGMYVCMPLISHDITDGMPALVLSLQKSDVSVSIKKELACQAQFHAFRLNFIDNFDEQSLMNFQEAQTGEVQSNFFFFPQGSYKLCSKASNDSGDAKWVLSVRSHMRGMIIDLDQRIGKMTKMLVNTISSFGEDDDFGECGHSDYQPDSDEDLIDGANELTTMQTEQRIRWMEQKMHEQSRLVADLVMQRAGEIQLEAERKKLRQYELVRFKEFRRSMVEKLKRSNDKKTAAIKRPSQASMIHPPLGPKISSARSDDGEPRRPQDTVSMHIDVQVNIESGACTLRTAPKTEVAPLTKRPSAKDLRAKNILAPLVNFTKFSIPSVDLKGYYVSGVQTGPPPGFPMSSERINLSFREKTSKRGCFYLSIALASMPSETVVTPHLADFLEQVLEPLPIPTGVHSVSSVESIADGPEAMTNIVAIDTSVLPLDVIFHLSVQSSTIRFDGQQQRSSAADCLLKLPSLTLIGSTRRTDGAEYPGGVDISATLSEFSLSIYSPHQQSTAHDALSLALDHLSFVVSRSKNASTEPDNRVRFVLTSNIGTANFNYDMRRLSELLAFPKPWFRKAIARRVFFGDQTGAGRTPAASKQSTIASANPAVKHVPDVVMDKPWSATVLLAVQWKELKVNAQMSNTMGTTSWIARKGLLRSLAKLNSRHERDITLTFKLDGSDLTAQGGAISGEVSLNKLGLSVTHKRFDKKPPRNKAVVELGSFATRIEWMSRVAIIGRCEHPSITLGDDFVETRNTQGDVTRVAVALNLKGSWDDLQIVITKTTIEDFIKIVSKLNTFFSEQLKNSRMVWKFDDEVAAASTMKQEEVHGEHDPPSHIGHWEQVLDLVTDIQYTLKLLVLPKNGETVVGGSVELEAKSCSLACMHGEMNANSWALFHLRNPSILFSPEAQFHYIDKANTTVGVSARQRLIIRLGGVPTNAEASQTENMANVCRVQQGRNSVMRTNASISSSLDYLIGDVLKQIGLSASHTPTGPVVTKSQHSVLELFQFPALEAVLTSLQSMECDPDSEICAPEVHSSFICEFHSAVYVQTDFNAQVSFLPELLKSYIHVHEEQQASMPKEEKPMKKDNRAYKCENWVVDPKIRFIDRFKWNPPVIDEVLRKLQIFDHRTTIPKALQRAVLDPLDAVLANGILQMLRLVDRSDYAKEQQQTATTSKTTSS